MDKEYAHILARVRLDRALELLCEAQELFRKESYKSANNRAFYSIEKAIRALLALEGTEAQTHNGTLKQFNFKFIFNGDGTFIQNDYQIAAKAECGFYVQWGRAATDNGL